MMMKMIMKFHHQQILNQILLFLMTIINIFLFFCNKKILVFICFFSILSDVYNKNLTHAHRKTYIVEHEQITFIIEEKKQYYLCKRNDIPLPKKYQKYK
jgi:hypothetical protein